MQTFIEGVESLSSLFNNKELFKITEEDSGFKVTFLEEAFRDPVVGLAKLFRKKVIIKTEKTVLRNRRVVLGSSAFEILLQQALDSGRIPWEVYNNIYANIDLLASEQL